LVSKLDTWQSWRRFAFHVFIVAAFGFAGAPALAQIQLAPPRPNIVYILADDLGYGDVGFNGQSLIKTPNIDALAAGGMRFVNGYCPASVCAPSRASLMTGFHNGHTYVDRLADTSPGFRAQDITVGEVLKGAGYTTGVIGKWGFGGTSDVANPTVNFPAALPTNQGFDEFYGELNHTRAHEYFPPTLWQADSSAPNGVSLTPTNGAYSHDLYAAKSEQFVTDHAHDSSPFFLYMAYTIPHFDNDAIANVPGGLDAYSDPQYSSWTDKEKKYASMITRMDGSIGSLMDRLNDPNHDGNTSDSIANNTLVVFMSDNGPSPEDGAPINFFDSSGPWRGGKRDLYEGGVHLPMVMRWNGTIAPGSTNSRLTDVADFLPTAAELAGVDGPVGMDGVSLAPTLLGQGLQRDRDYLIFENHGTTVGPAGGPPPSWGIRRGDYKLIKFSDGTYGLYNLQSDPGETNNVVASNMSRKTELESIALAEGVEQGGEYTVEFRNWTAGSGSFSNPVNWGVSESPAEYWSATIGNTSGSAKTITVSGNSNVLGLEVSGVSGTTRVNLDASSTLTARNEARIKAGGEIHLNGGTLSTVRWVDVRSGGLLQGGGRVNGVIYNQGTVAPGGVGPLGAPGNPSSPVAALQFNFQGVQDNAPLTATTVKHANLQLVAGLNFGAGTNPRTGSTNAGNEFNVAGFFTTSLANAIAADDYLIYTVAPVSGLEMKLSSVRFNLWRNGTNAAQNYAVMTSADGFSASSEIATLNVSDSGSTNQHAISGDSTQWVGGDIEVRLYGWNAANSSGNTHVNAVSTSASFRTAPQATVRPTGLLSLEGDYVQFADATLEIEVGGSNFGSTTTAEYDRLAVSGNAKLDGTLAVKLIEGYQPKFGDVFDVLDFAALQDQFSSLNLPALSGLSWDASDLYTTGSLTVVPEPVEVISLLAIPVLARRRQRSMSA
jgi:arylsulfatase A-like enzyme